MTAYFMTLLKGNVGQGYSGYEKDGVIARYDGKERLLTVEGFNLREIKMEAGYK